VLFTKGFGVTHHSLSEGNLLLKWGIAVEWGLCCCHGGLPVLTGVQWYVLVTDKQLHPKFAHVLQTCGILHCC